MENLLRRHKVQRLDPADRRGLQPLLFNFVQQLQGQSTSSSLELLCRRKRCRKRGPTKSTPRCKPADARIQRNRRAQALEAAESIARRSS